MNSENNPYLSPFSVSSEQAGSQPIRPLSRSATLFLANVIVVGAAVIVGEILCFLVLLPPMNRWFGTTGEFDILILIGMPIWAGGVGLIAANILGFAYPRKFCSGIAIMVSLGIVAMVFLNTAKTNDRSDALDSTLTFSGILVIAITTGVLIARQTLRRVNRIRSMPVPSLKGQGNTTAFRRKLLVFLTLLFFLIDAAVLWDIVQGSDGIWLFPVSLFGLVFGLVVVAFNAYHFAAHDDVRKLAKICLALMITGLAATIFLWVRYVLLR